MSFVGLRCPTFCTIPSIHVGSRGSDVARMVTIHLPLYVHSVAKQKKSFEPNLALSNSSRSSISNGIVLLAFTRPAAAVVAAC